MSMPLEVDIPDAVQIGLSVVETGEVGLRGLSAETTVQSKGPSTQILIIIIEALLDSHDYNTAMP